MAALKVVILTTFGAANEEHFVKMMTFPFSATLWRQNHLMRLYFIT